MWINDLKEVGYRDIQSLFGGEDSEEKSPCIGRDALSGVYFHPAPAIGKSMAMTGHLTYLN